MVSRLMKFMICQNQLKGMKEIQASQINQYIHSYNINTTLSGIQPLVNNISIQQ